MTSRTSPEPSPSPSPPDSDNRAGSVDVSRRRFAAGLAAIVPALAVGSAVAAEPAQAATGHAWRRDGNKDTSEAEFLGTHDAQPLRFATGKTERMRLDAEGRLGIGTAEPDAPLHVEGDLEAIVGHSGKFGVQGAGSVGVHGEALGPDTFGVYGFAAGARGRAFGGGARGPESFGMQVGVAGRHSFGVFSEAGGVDSTAVFAIAHEARSHGVYGAALGRDSAGIFADAREASAGAHALWAEGRTHVNAQSSHAGAGFKIDHPQDPAGRFLGHSVVESDQRKTVYDGVVRLDAAGRATVRLPDWFAALNADARYQLTAIGAAMPRLHVSREIKGDTFEIAGGAAGKEVSWQVTGVRQDAWAIAHPLVIEERKVAGTAGRLLHPDLHPGTAAAVLPRPAGPSSEVRSA
jgi:hypothetical protein